MEEKPPHQKGVEHEPHFRAAPPVTHDEASNLDEEPARATEVNKQDVEFSVADEPALGWIEIDRDIHPGFGELLDDRTRTTSSLMRLGMLFAVAACTGPAAVVGAVFESLLGSGSGWGFYAIVVGGPVAEEMLKIMLILWLVERKPWLLGSVVSIMALGITSGIAFGAIENLMYLHVYYPESGSELASWRWTITMPMHGICSLIAAIGASRMWMATYSRRIPASTGLAFPWLAAAMIVHGVYNAFAVAMSMLGIEPT